LTFTIFNPSHPTNPINQELHIAENFALAVKEAFALEEFQHSQKLHIDFLIKQKGSTAGFSSSFTL